MVLSYGFIDVPQLELLEQVDSLLAYLSGNIEHGSIENASVRFINPL